MTPSEVLDLKIQDSDIGPTTIGGYLAALLSAVVRDGEGFDGKRPFGNSGWVGDLYRPLLAAGLVAGRFDAEGYLEDVDERAAVQLLVGCIEDVLT